MLIKNTLGFNIDITAINDCYGFIIDTDKPAYQFERELCAFITGKIGDCNIGENMIEIPPMSFDNIMFLPDDNGTKRPVTIYTTPFTEKELLEYEKEKEKYILRYEKQMESIKNLYGYSDSSLKDLLLNCEVNFKLKLKELVPSGKQNSVCILFQTYPTEEQIEYMKNKCKFFLGEISKRDDYYNPHSSRSQFLTVITDKPPINFNGFRVINFLTQEESFV